MKIIILAKDNTDKAEFILDYLEDTYAEMMADIIVADISPYAGKNSGIGKYEGITYVYFEEKVMPGSALNQVIKGLEIDDDTLVMDPYHIPLMDAFGRLQKALVRTEDTFAVGPVSNSFGGWQKAGWKSAEEALDWSIDQTEGNTEEVLYLFSGVILFNRSVFKEDKPFNEEIEDLGNLILEKCMREFLEHKRMYICSNSGFWDTRGNAYEEKMIADDRIFERLYGVRYMNVSGNFDMISCFAGMDDIDREVYVLEIGCDCGGTLFEIKRIFKNAHLYGTDINDNALRFASEFANVKVNNIEEKNIDFGIKFDYVIFGDVLEHLRDPLGALIYCKEILCKGGRIVASIPNLMNIGVVKDLLDGNFTYRDTGLLDRTHIHMFTYREIIRMFENDAGYKIEKMSMNTGASKEYDDLIDSLVNLGDAERFMYEAFQFQIVARLD